MRSAVPFQFTSFFYGRQRRKLHHKELQAQCRQVSQPHVWLSTAPAPALPAKGSPCSPLPCPSSLHPKAPSPQSPPGQWKARLLYFLCFTGSTPRHSEIRLAARGPQAACDTAGSWAQPPKPLVWLGGLVLASLMACPGVSPAPQAHQTAQIPQQQVTLSYTLCPAQPPSAGPTSPKSLPSTSQYEQHLPRLFQHLPQLHSAPLPSSLPHTCTFGLPCGCRNGPAAGGFSCQEGHRAPASRGREAGTRAGI